ncbi:MAG: RNA polymerase sigma factor, partial [Acidimicrobiales bacterium]
EALVRAWRHAQAYDPRRGSVVTWLLTITRNLGVDQLRLKRPDAVDPKDIVEPWPPQFVPGPDDLAVGADDARRLGSVLAGLPGDQRRALVLAAFGGRTAAEIGHIEGIPLGTAKTRIRTALIKVRASMVSTPTPTSAQDMA